MTPWRALAEGKGMPCYGGLLHSQLEFKERKQVGNKLVQHMMLVRLCDTCGHRIEEEKTSESDIVSHGVINIDEEEN